MKAISILILVLTLFVPGHAVAGENLENCFKAAMKRSEVIGEQKELVIQAEENIKQARGLILPSINGQAGYLRQQSAGVTASGTQISPTKQPLVKITGDQPLFRGFRDFAALKAEKQLAQAQAQARRQAVLQLYEDMAQAFYARRTYEQELVNLADELASYDSRVTELKERINIGRSRLSEVLQLNASIEALNAVVEQTKGQLLVAQETFAFLTGLPGDTPLSDDEAIPSDINSMDQYVSSVSQRPDTQADRDRYNAAKEGVWVAKGAHLPSVDLLGDYYIKRTGVTTDVKWDVAVNLTMPLFEGGIISSQVREARSVQRQAELTFQATTRQAEEEVRSRYRTLQSDLAQVKALERATDVSKKSYEAERHDYRLGLVTNLDVLQALTSFKEATRALDRTRIAAKLDYDKLESSVAHRPKGLEGI